MILEKLDRRVNLKKIQVVFLLEIGNRHEFQVTMGCMGGWEGSWKGRGLERREQGRNGECSGDCEGGREEG